MKVISSGILYPHTQSRKKMVNTVLIVNITHICKNSLDDKSVLFNHSMLFILHIDTNKKPGFYLQLAN